MKAISIAFSLASILVAASSCSTINSILGKDSQAGTGSSVNTTAVSPTGKTNQKGDRRETAPTEFNNKPTSDDLCGGKWIVISVGDVNVDDADEDTPYVQFDTSGRFYANDGCNIINGDYAMRSDGTIAFNNTLSTMKYCPDVEYSALIASMFNDASKLGADCKRIGQDSYLYLKGENGNVLMTLRRHNMEFLNGNWQITSVDGKKLDDPEANIFIDIAELKVHGNTGCNYFNGEIYINPGRSNAIDFSNMGMTRMGCPKAEQEQKIMVALEETSSAIAGKNENTVLLINKKGREVITLKRIPLPTEE